MFAVVALLSISYAAVDTGASCPDSSYTQYTVNTTEPISGCAMEIVFCYKQLPGGDRSIQISEINFDLTGCLPSLIEFDYNFWDFVDQEVLRKIDTLFPFDPCPHGGGQTNLISEITKANCLEVIDDPIEQMSYIVPCGTGSADCVTYYKVCKEDGEFDILLESGPYKQGFDACPPAGENPPDIYMNTCFSSCY